MYQGCALHARVRIGAAFEQRLHDVEVGGLLVIHFLRLREARARLPPGVDRGPERRDAVDITGEFDVGALLDELHRQVELAVDERDEHWRVAVGGFLVDVRAGVEQHGHCGREAIARRVMQRRHAALRMLPDTAGPSVLMSAADLTSAAALRRPVPAPAAARIGIGGCTATASAAPPPRPAPPAAAAASPPPRPPPAAAASCPWRRTRARA